MALMLLLTSGPLRAAEPIDGSAPACVIGRLSDGTGIFGCDGVVTH